MSERLLLVTLIEFLEGDLEILEHLCEAGLVPREEEALLPEHAEMARVACTLVHELGINWPGAEVILRMRSELAATHRQVEELLALLREGRTER